MSQASASRPAPRPAPRPAARPEAWRAVGRCAVASTSLLVRGRVRQPRSRVGRVVRFADGTQGRVYRETVVARVPAEPCFLAVAFRLRWVHGPRGHAVFRAESLLNTPLFVGFPGFVSKLWLAADERHVYRGLYEWDGAGRAEGYARSLWRVLELVSERGSIDYRVVPGLTRDEALARLVPTGTGDAAPDDGWWRVVP
ncbi:hypothetical protein [Isoptericola haloaureus]|uniref:DUF4166 domain-containing protein n=1 Tax=Isoptericola haloaureus TaxID=1542902 RepID=A0ABU7ZB31_9MICO